jgi:hypothetical protein
VVHIEMYTMLMKQEKIEKFEESEPAFYILYANGLYI